MSTMHDAGRGHLFLAVHEGTPLAGVFIFAYACQHASALKGLAFS